MVGEGGDFGGLTARNLLLEERSRKPGFGGIHGGERGLIIAIVCLFGYRLLMKPTEIYLIILIGFFLCIWGVGEFLWRKSKDAGWINKAKGNKSVRKYRESIAGQKFGELSKIEKQQLIAAITNEQMRIVSRAVPWFFIIMFLITGLE